MEFKDRRPRHLRQHRYRRRHRPVAGAIRAMRTLLIPTVFLWFLLGGLGVGTITAAAEPVSWRTHTWHYPVIKRPLSPEEISNAADLQRDEPPVIRLAGGEFEMAVLAMHRSEMLADTSPVRHLQELVVDLRELPAGYTVSIYYLEPFTVERKTRWFDSAAVTGPWFDPCVPMPPVLRDGDDDVLRFDISSVSPPEPGDGRYFLFEIYASRDASRRPGTIRVYATTADASAGGAPIGGISSTRTATAGSGTVGSFPPVRIEPFSFDLPEEHSLPLLAGIVPEDVFAIHRTYGLLPENEPALWLDYLTLLREHRIVPYDPAPQKDFNWETFENISLPLYRGELTPDRVPAPAIRFPENRYPRDTPERLAFYRDVADRFRREGLLERTFYYVDDEPLMGDFTRLISDARELADVAPEVRRLVTESYNPQLAGLIDIWTPDITMLNQPVPFFPLFGKGSGLQPDFQMNPDVDVYRSEMEAGRELWLYTCTSAQYADLPNLFIDAPPAAARVIPWMVHRYDATGMVYFRVTQAYKDGNDPWEDQYYFAANGDGTLVYPAYPDLPWFDGHGAVASLRMKLLRDGLEDYEYLLRAGTSGPIHADIGAEVVRSTTTWEHDLTTLAAARDALGEEISLGGRGVPGAPGTVGAAPRPVESFNQVSQPSLTVDWWYLPEFWSPSGRAGSFLVPSYRHLLASALDAGRRQATVATRGRWQAYLQAGPVLGLSGNTVNYGGYSAVGWTVSPETSRRLNRNWLIPYLGIEGGVLSGNDGSNTETGFAGSVLAGVHLWSTPRTSLTIGGAWTHTTTDAVPVAFRGTVAFDFVLDGR